MEVREGGRREEGRREEGKEGGREGRFSIKMEVTIS